MDKSVLMQLGLVEETAERIAQALEGYIAPDEAEALRERIGELEAEIAEHDRAHRQEIRQIRLDTAMEAAMKAAGAKNMRAVRALIDEDALKVCEDGSVEGLDTQINALAQSVDSEFLFEKKQKLRGVILGEDAAEGFEDRAGLDGMSYDELCLYFEK